MILICDTRCGHRYYPIELHYDYACALTKGNFIPPGFHAVSSCRFYGFLSYGPEANQGIPVPRSPAGTGGGAHPKPPAGVPFDLTNPPDWNKTRPELPEPEPEEPDVRYVVNLGLNGPLYQGPNSEPLSKGRWYMVRVPFVFFFLIDS